MTDTRQYDLDYNIIKSALIKRALKQTENVRQTEKLVEALLNNNISTYGLVTKLKRQRTALEATNKELEGIQRLQDTQTPKVSASTSKIK